MTVASDARAAGQRAAQDHAPVLSVPSLDDPLAVPGRSSACEVGSR
jgi:hypothetical protein